jgi:hypothetical protein
MGAIGEARTLFPGTGAYKDANPTPGCRRGGSHVDPGEADIHVGRVSRAVGSRRMRAAIEAHLGSERVSRVIYGSIIGLALVVTLEDHPPKAGVVVASICATALAVSLAELYSDLVGAETRTHARPERVRVRVFAKEASAAALGIAFPAVFFVLAAAGALEVDTAFTIAKWSGLGLIGLYGYFGARLSGRSLPAAILHAVAVGLIGGFLIGFKALLH